MSLVKDSGRGSTAGSTILRWTLVERIEVVLWQVQKAHKPAEWCRNGQVQISNNLRNHSKGGSVTGSVITEQPAAELQKQIVGSSYQRANTRYPTRNPERRRRVGPARRAAKSGQCGSMTGWQEPEKDRLETGDNYKRANKNSEGQQNREHVMGREEAVS